MLRLPNSSESFDKLKSFSSYMLSKRIQNDKKIIRPSSSTFHRKSKSYYLQQSQKLIKDRIRPKSSIAKPLSDPNVSALLNLALSNNISEYTLISPCNKKFNYCITSLDVDHIDAKVVRSNFLLEPCKISSIPIRARRELDKKEFVITPQNEKYSTPYRKELNEDTNSHKNKHKIKPATPREKVHKKIIKKQQKIDAWQIGQFYFQSIKLNQKNSDS